MAEVALLAAYLLLAVLVLLWLYLRREQDAADAFYALAVELVPSFTGLVLAFVIAATFLERRGLTGGQQLRRSVVADVVKQVKPVPSVREVYTLIQTTPYGDVFAGSDRLELVGRWYNETLQRHPLDLARFLEQGGQMLVVLMDPDDDVAVRQAASQYVGSIDPSPATIAQVRQKTLETITVLERLCRDEPRRFEAQVSVHLTRMPLNAWGIRSLSRTSGDALYFAPYDHARVQTSACPTVVFDLDQSPETRTYWTQDVSGLLRCSQTLAEWRRAAAQGLVAAGGTEPSSASVSLRGSLVQEALRAAGFEEVAQGSATGAGMSGRSATWRSNTEEWVLDLGADDCVNQVRVQARGSA